MASPAPTPSLRLALCLAAVLSVVPIDAVRAGNEGYATSRAALHGAVDDYARTVVEGGLMGVLTGAATGAVAGLISGDPRNVGRGAAIGAGIGGLGGLLDGAAVAERKQHYARAEDGLDAAIGKARARNQKLARVVRSADKLVAVRRAELARLRTDDAAGRRAELQRAVDQDVDEIDSALSKAKTARDEARSLLTQYRDAPRASGLGREVSENEGAVRRLTEDRQQLQTMRNGL